MAGYFTFDYEVFITTFPAFSDPVKYPEAVLSLNWTHATCYIANDNFGVSLTDDCKAYAINLMAAHITYTNTTIGKGQVPGIMQQAAIDQVSVGLTPPPLPNNWQWWLMTSPYGQQLLALLKVSSAGGWYIGGLPERDAFRKVYGTFYSN